jgi:pyruvate-formate lyase-activating enzyme
MPLFLPEPEIGNKFSRILDKYPVTPYLDNRESFIRWTYFIHNKYNYLLNKEQISFEEFIANYKREYLPKSISMSEKYAVHKYYIFAALVLICFAFIYIYYDK